MQILICYCVCRFEIRGFTFSIPSFYLFTKKEHVIFLDKKKRVIPVPTVCAEIVTLKTENKRY